jgi:hypothetical protein
MFEFFSSFIYLVKIRFLKAQKYFQKRETELTKHNPERI